MSNLKPAGVFKRVKAATIDTIFIMMIIYTASFLFAQFEGVNETIRGIVFVAIFILYEPLFVSVFGSSLGHMFCDLRVQKDDSTGKNVSLPVAIIRFLLKTALGWMSLLSISGDSKKRAIHDLAAKSVVIYVGEEK